MQETPPIHFVGIFYYVSLVCIQVICCRTTLVHRVAGKSANSSLKLASFPDLPHFYLPFVFTVIHGSGSPAKNSEGLGAIIT